MARGATGLRPAALSRGHLAEAPTAKTEKYRRLFRSAPAAIWEEDISRVYEELERLRDKGVKNLRKHLTDNPDFLRKVSQMIMVTEVNDEAVKMYRAHSREELLGPRSRLLVPSSVEALQDQIVAIAENRPLLDTEAITETLDGTAINVMVRIAILPGSGETQKALVTVIDRTELKKARDSWRDSEEKFRAVFRSARDCIHIKDVDLRLTEVNPATENLLGRPASELVGLTDEQIYGVEAAIHLTEMDLRVLGGEVIEEEHTRPVKGNMRTFSDTRMPLRNEEREIIGVCVISRDVTKWRMAAALLEASQYEYPSAAMRSTLSRARQVAATDSLVLLLGESGSGKDFLARYIHAHSRRSNGPFFVINCAALTHELAESELFGHEPGAFTGARARKRGLLELAEGGTLLLNEIGELPQGIQSKLLTFLDSRSFLRVGGEKTVSVSTRLIAATHRDLRQEVAEGRFLKALYYRLNVFCVRVPSLRERLEDIPSLARELMAGIAKDMRLPRVPRLGPSHMEALEGRAWPGNVRELRNVLERAAIVWENGGADPDFLSDEPSGEEHTWKLSSVPDLNVQRWKDELTQELCREALRRSGGNKKEAARLLGVSRFSFYRYLRAAGLADDEVADS